MKTKFLPTAMLTIVSVFSLCFSHLSAASPSSQGKQIYEWRIYTANGDVTPLDIFFEETLIPAYERQNIDVGAFSLLEKGEKEQRYLVFIYPDIETFYEVSRNIWKDPIFVESAQPFFDQTASQHTYAEYESYLCEAFDKIPTILSPDKDRTLFEYRLYQSPNDDANKRKVKMFNDEEIDLFNKVDINSVCYGEVLSGTHMPALIYLTWYKDEKARNEAWDKFVKHPDWLNMKDKPEYANTATSLIIKQLLPMPYSHF